MSTSSLTVPIVVLIASCITTSIGIADETITVNLKEAKPEESVFVAEITKNAKDRLETQTAKHHIDVYGAEDVSRQTIDRLLTAARHLPAADKERISTVVSVPSLANRNGKYTGSQSVVHSIKTDAEENCDFRVNVRLFFKCSGVTWSAKSTDKGELWRLTKDNVLHRLESPKGWIVAHY